VEEMVSRAGLVCRFCGAPLSTSSWTLARSRSPTPTWRRRTCKRRRHSSSLCFRLWRVLSGAASGEEGPEAIFSDYAYFSSYSETWLRHAETYAAAMIERFGLDLDTR